MKATNGFTTFLPTTTASSDPSFMNRLDLISVTILGSVVALCTLICCCVGLRKRKVLPNESQLVDIHHTDELDENNTFGAELRHPQRLDLHRREPRTPDSPPPTYSVLERQMSFTSSISQSSSQIELPPNYEEAAGLGRHSLMSTLIPEEGPAVATVVAKETPYRRSESAHRNQPTRPKRANRSKSDIEKSRRSRNQHNTDVCSPPIDISMIIESTSTLSPPDLLRKPLGTPGSNAPLLTSQEPQEHLRSPQVRPSSDSTVTATSSPSKPKLSRSSTDV